MSIYASIPGIDGDAPCGPPWIYVGSHILPADDDQRGGEVSLAHIPSHITRDGRDDAPEDGKPWPWLRVCVDVPTGSRTLILNAAQARHLAQQLTAWANDAEPIPAAPRYTVDSITNDALTALYDERDLLTQGVAARSALLEEARDALSAAGITGAHGDDWPRITPAIEELARRADSTEPQDPS